MRDITSEDKELMDALKDEYSFLKWVKYDEKWVLCGLRRMAFTIGLFYGLDKVGYIGRYCFPDLTNALLTLSELEEIPDDLIIKGNWIKHKGHTEISNPK